ncbi:MAG: hypothetical protein L6Q59_15355, partial [Ignavibacteriaceae bacterium]|nr:hypothetical protein [Ignavibacteriaceae bacterium]
MKNRLSSYKEIIELTSAIDTLLASGGSKGFLLLYYSRMIMLLSDTGDEAFFEANFRLHEGPYLDSLKMYGAAGHDPGHTGLILTAAESLKKFSSHNVNQELINQTERIRREKIRLDDVLQGKVTSGPEQAAALLFPVIDTDAGGESLTHLESISVKIIPVNKETRFIIHPTYRSQDPVLGAQVKTSFENALILSSGIFTFPHKEFDVYVTFNSAIGDYSGESFGAALALEMFFELNRLYNKSTDAGAAARMIISGGVDENGQIKPLGKKSTIFKTRAAFYSDADYFIVSPEDEHTAKAELSELQKKFPHRKLKIPGIEDLREITQRRYFVTIKRKSVPKRTAQFLRRNAFAAAITVMLIFTLGLYLAYRTDTNPVDYEFGEGIVKIKNKFGNVIWTAEAKVSTAPVRMGLSHMNLFCRIMDIDGDGKNEVLISEAKIKEGEHRGKTGLVCMRAPDDILWSYCATDTVKSVKEPLIPVEYAIKII